VQARVNAEQASRRTMCRLTRQPTTLSGKADMARRPPGLAIPGRSSGSLWYVKPAHLIRCCSGGLVQAKGLTQQPPGISQMPLRVLDGQPARGQQFVIGSDAGQHTPVFRRTGESGHQSSAFRLGEHFIDTVIGGHACDLVPARRLASQHLASVAAGKKAARETGELGGPACR
jgi:hypothetical protein